MFEYESPLQKEAPKYDWIFLGIALCVSLPFYISACGMIIALLYLMASDRSHLKDMITQTGYMGLFVLMAALTATFRWNIIGVATALGMWLFILLMSFYYSSITPRRYKCMQQTLIATSLVPIGVTLWSYYKYLQSEGLGWLYIVQTSSPRFRADATFFNANYYGYYCILIILVCVYRLFKDRWGIKSLYYVSMILINLLGIVMTASRMLYPALVVGVVVLLIFIDKRFGFLALLVGSLGVATLVLKPSLFPRFSSLAYAFEDRYKLWTTGWKIFKHSPLTGHGPLSYLRYYYLFQGKATLHSHSLYIDSLASYGLFGVFVLFLGLVDFIRRCLTAIEQRYALPELGLVLSFIAVTLVHGITDVSIFWPQTAYVFAVIVLVPFDLLGKLEK